MLSVARWSSPPRSPTCCCCSRWRTSATARARSGRSIIGNAWVYALSMAVYCTAWTYFGSVGRAATAGVWFLPIYLGPTLAMVLAWMVLRKMIRIAKTYRITSIADFIASRYGKSPLLAGAGDPDHGGRHRALHRAAAQGDRQRLCAADHAARRAARRAARLVARQHASTSRSRWPASRSCSAPATSTAPSATKAWSRRSPSSRSSSCSAFLAVGAFVTWGLFDGPADLFARAAATPELAQLLAPRAGRAASPTSSGSR